MLRCRHGSNRTNGKGNSIQMKLYRVEDKYCCTGQEFYELQRRLDAVLRVDGNGDGGEGYCVDSLYFDDFADTCLADVSEGNDNRLKYRIRIYNHVPDIIKLEVKEKRNSKILKRGRCITVKELEKLVNGECIEDLATTDDPAFLFNMAIRTQGLRPKVIVAYIYPPGNVRITFDRNIRASRETEAFGIQGISYDFLEGQDYILEIKYDEFLPQFIPQLMETGCLRQVSYSKYRICRERYGGF